MKSMKSMKKFMKSPLFLKRTEQVEKLIFHNNFLLKAISDQRTEIQQRKATEERQKAIIKYLKAELKEVKAKKAMKAMKSMKAK